MVSSSGQPLNLEFLSKLLYNPTLLPPILKNKHYKLLYHSTCVPIKSSPRAQAGQVPRIEVTNNVNSWSQKKTHNLDFFELFSGSTKNQTMPSTGT